MWIDGDLRKIPRIFSPLVEYGAAFQDIRKDTAGEDDSMDTRPSAGPGIYTVSIFSELNTARQQDLLSVIPSSHGRGQSGKGLWYKHQHDSVAETP